MLSKKDRIILGFSPILSLQFWIKNVFILYLLIASTVLQYNNHNIVGPWLLFTAFIILYMELEIGFYGFCEGRLLFAEKTAGYKIYCDKYVPEPWAIEPLPEWREAVLNMSEKEAVYIVFGQNTALQRTWWRLFMKNEPEGKVISSSF